MKLNLTIETSSLSGRKFELKNGFLTVGRSENCAVRFDPQKEIVASKQHAYIEAKSDGFYIIDKQSTNGTFLNGQKIQTSKLNSGGMQGFIIGYVIFKVPFFLIFVGSAIYIMRRQNKILKEMLTIDVARGLISQQHLQIATSAFRSSFWILGGVF